MCALTTGAELIHAPRCRFLIGGNDVNGAPLCVGIKAGKDDRSPSTKLQGKPVKVHQHPRCHSVTLHSWISLRPTLLTLPHAYEVTIVLLPTITAHPNTPTFQLLNACHASASILRQLSEY